jgi:hypothetical protein
MKLTLLGLLACLFLACAPRPKPQATAPKPKQATATTQDSIRCFKVIQTFPYRDYLGRLMRYDSFYAYIYTWHNQLLYRTSYIYTITKVEDSILVIDKILTRYKDLVFTRGQPSGALYDLDAGIVNKKVPADSMLKDLWVTRSGIFEGPSIVDTVLVSRKWQPNSDTTLVEEYIGKLKRDTTFKVFSTLKLWYTRPLRGCPISFNPRLDSLRGQQVCRFYANNRIEYVMEGQPIVSAFTQNYTLQEIPVTNAAELLPIFERNKKGEYSAQVADILKN